MAFLASCGSGESTGGRTVGSVGRIAPRSRDVSRQGGAEGAHPVAPATGPGRHLTGGVALEGLERRDEVVRVATAVGVELLGQGPAPGAELGRVGHPRTSSTTT